MIVDLTDYGFNIIEISRPDKFLSDANIINGVLIILNNPLQVDSYYFPDQGIYSYRYLSIPVENLINDASSPFETMNDINEYLSLFDFNKLKIEERWDFDFRKFFENRVYKAELDIDEEMLLYIKIKYGIEGKQNV